MDGSLLSDTIPLLKILYNCEQNTYKAIVKDKKLSKLIEKSIKELAYNYLYTDLECLTLVQRRKLQKIKHILREIVHKKKILPILAKNRSAIRVILEPLHTTLKC